MEHQFTKAEISAFKDMLSKALRLVFGGSSPNHPFGARISGRTFADGSVGYGFMISGLGAEQFVLIEKTPPALQVEMKLKARALLRAVISETKKG